MQVALKKGPSAIGGTALRPFCMSVVVLRTHASTPVIATCSRAKWTLVVREPGERMTSRERKDMPWVVTAFVAVLMVIVVGAFFLWH
jgi:hypothetical protein